MYCLFHSSGFAYLDDCSIEPLIPIFLIIAGVCGVLKSIGTLVKQLIICCKFSMSRSKKFKYMKYTWRIVELLFNILLFAWFIAGSYWVFHVYDDLQAAEFDPKLCNPVLYKCAFGIMICSYILLFMTCCCVCVCACFRKPPAAEEEGGREDGDQFPECDDDDERQGTSSSPPIGDSVPLASSLQVLDDLSSAASVSSTSPNNSQPYLNSDTTQL